MDVWVMFAFAVGLSGWIAWQDWKERLIDDRYSGGLLVLALLLAFVARNTSGLTESAIGAGLLALLFFGVRLGWKKYKSVDALGAGDIGLALACGALVGWPGLAVFLILAPIFGIGTSLFWRYTYGEDEAPFAPALLAGAILVCGLRMAGYPVGILHPDEAYLMWSSLGFL